MAILPDPSGLSQGISAIGTTLGKTIQDVASKRAQMSQLQQILNPPQANISEDPKFRQDFVDKIKNVEAKTGQKLTDKQKDMAWDASVKGAQSQQQPSNQQGAGGQPQYSVSQLAAISQQNPALANLIQQNQLAQQRIGHQEKKLEQTEKLAYLKLNEPQMVKATDKLDRLNEQKLELGRLNELFTTHADKMPPAWKAAVFNYGGEGFLSRAGRASLTPEAQEVVKLITGQIKGLNQTFRGRILETEIKYYMKTWPTLLNTREGKLKIMRDIELMHKVQENVLNNTLDEVDKAGGKISWSDAQRRALRKSKPEFEKIKKLFIKPEQQTKELGPPPEGMVRMHIPSIGKVKNIPKDRIKEVEAAGGKVIR